MRTRSGFQVELVWEAWLVGATCLTRVRIAHREVELKVGGDWVYHNTSPSAAELVKWLESLLTAENMK